MRAIPLLMIFSVVLFLTTEMWQVFSAWLRCHSRSSPGCSSPRHLFPDRSLPREVRSLEREAGSEGAALDRRQRLNVGLVLFVSQALQVLVVSLAVGVFFVAFGVLIVDADVLRSWIGSERERSRRRSTSSADRASSPRSCSRLRRDRRVHRASTSRSRCSPTRSIAASSSRS